MAAVSPVWCGVVVRQAYVLPLPSQVLVCCVDIHELRRRLSGTTARTDALVQISSRLGHHSSSCTATSRHLVSIWSRHVIDNSGRFHTFTSTPDSISQTPPNNHTHSCRPPPSHLAPRRVVFPVPERATEPHNLQATRAVPIPTTSTSVPRIRHITRSLSRQKQPATCREIC